MDVPSQPPVPHEQVMEQRLVGCGLDASGLTIRYEEELQGIEIIITPNAGASAEKFDCIRQAVGYEIVTFEDRDMQRGYLDHSFEEARPQLLAEAEEGLRKRGLLEGFPERANFGSDKLFAEALERHCGAEPGSFFVESQWGLIAQPPHDVDPPSGAEWDRLACLLNAMMYGNAKGEGFKVGFIGNEKFRESEGE
jgi:hypothetical protein